MQLSIMKSTFSISLFILPFLLLAQTQEKPDDFAFLVNISIMDNVYSLNSKSKKRSFLLQVCTASECADTLELGKNASPDIVSRGVINFVRDNFDSRIVYDSVADAQIEHIQKLLTVAKQKEFEDIEAAKTESERVQGEIDRGKNQYSGKLIIRKTPKYWLTDSKKKAKLVNYKSFISKNTKGTGTLEIIDSKIKFFNNKASSIYIKAKLTETGEDPETLIFLNNNFSVAVRYFNYYGNRVSAQRNDEKWVTIDFNDVFDYESDQYYNYSVANDQISLSTVSPDSMSAKIKQRRFFDYFTAIVYSDVLSFNTENSNSLLNAQAKLLIPLNLRNAGQLSFMRQFSTSVNIALSNSFSDETRFIAIKDNETFNHFDLLKKHNLNGKLDFQAINLEYKRLFMNISLGYSAAFYRAGFQYTQTAEDIADIVTNRQILSLAHGPFLNFEIRPQSNFGADINVSFEDLNYNDSKSINGRNFSNSIIHNSGHNHFGFKHNLVNVEVNFYWLTSDDKTGGVYTKLGSYYHTESHEIFPQIMVGYATNLTSFVNRFKPKNKTEDTN
jgi:hypothetical protein